MTALDIEHRATSDSARTAAQTRRASEHAARDAAVADLFQRLRTYTPGRPEHTELRERIAAHYMGAAKAIASRYGGRGEPIEDIEQAALLGLVKAINGFDPDLGHDFVAYAIPMMVGEVKRHFRDKTWAVRVPRRYQERRGELNGTIRTMTQELGRSPTMNELGAAMGLTVEELSDLMEASAAYSALSLDSPTGDGGDDGANLGDTIGGYDSTLESVVDRASLPPLLRALPERERRIVLLRFFGNLTQSQIAEQVGVSQMHVSRLLSSALSKMRSRLLEER